MHQNNYPSTCSNLDQYSRSLAEAAHIGDFDNVPEYRERFWYSLYKYPNTHTKQKKQIHFCCKDECHAGCRLFTLREIADMEGRVLRRFVSMDRSKLNDYLFYNFHFLLIDIDEIKVKKQLPTDKALVGFAEMKQMVKQFRSDEFPEVYVRPSTSTKKVPCKFHLYVRTREPFYYRLPVVHANLYDDWKQHRKKRPDENGVLCEEEMTYRFLEAFKAANKDYFETHEFAKVDTALYKIHQTFHSAPSSRPIKKLIREVYDDTYEGFVPVIGSKTDSWSIIPTKYQSSVHYPCEMRTRSEAWGITFFPRSFDIKLPSVSYSFVKVPDGRRTAFARRLTDEIWTAAHFNIKYYPQHAEPYDKHTLFKQVMSEVHVGAELLRLNVAHIEDVVKHTIETLDSTAGDVDDHIKACYTKTVVRRVNELEVIDDDPYLYNRRDRHTRKHAEWVIRQLETDGIIKDGRFTREKPEVMAALKPMHISLTTLLSRGIKQYHCRKPRSDRGRAHTGERAWQAIYLDLCIRDCCGDPCVPAYMTRDDSFRQYCFRHGIHYSSAKRIKDPMQITNVCNLPSSGWDQTCSLDEWNEIDLANEQLPTDANYRLNKRHSNAYEVLRLMGEL